MALKKFDIPEVDDAIADAKREEQLRKVLETADKIAVAIQSFIRESPDVIKAMRAVIPLLDAKKFAAQAGEDLRKTTDVMARKFMADISQLVDRMEKNEKKVSISELAFYVIITTLFFLSGFFAAVVFANVHSLHSEALSKTVALTAACWAVVIAGVIFLSKRP